MFTYGKDIPLDTTPPEELDIKQLSNNISNSINISPIYIYGKNINWESMPE